MSEIVLTDQNFKDEVLKEKGVVLVDFWAPWCGPCRVQGPIIEQLAKEMSGIKFGKLNVDENSAIASQYGIMSIPTLIIFKDGKTAEQLIGVQAKDQLKRKLEAIK
jgi:thioredoxin 1